MKTDAPESEMPLKISVTIKEINEDDDQGILRIAFTFTVKQSRSIEVFNYLSFNVDQSGDKIPEYRNLKTNFKTGEFSSSAHFNVELNYKDEVDCCPYIISNYDLSVKVNALDDNNERGKIKCVFQERSFKDFIEFQRKSLGSNVSKSDMVSIHARSKIKSGKEGPKFRTAILKDDLITLDNENYETDEIVFRFTTRKKQLSNIVSVCLPCFIVPMIFAESLRRNLLTMDLTMAAVFTLVFSMPKSFGLGTGMWFSISYIFLFITYLLSSSTAGLVLEVSIAIFYISMLIIAWVLQDSKMTLFNKLGVKICDVVKDRDDSWRKLSWQERLGLV